MRDDELVDRLRRYADGAAGAVGGGDVVPIAGAPRGRPAVAWRVAAVAVVVALVAGGLLLVTGTGDDDDEVETDVATAPPDAAWSTFPNAPIAGRIGAAAEVVDDELLVWGGRGDVDLGDGAAWSTAASSWRTLPPAPIGARAFAVDAWTGEEWLVVGGYAGADQLDGAAYDPATDAWRPIAPAPIGAVAGATGAAWTGRELVVVGKQGAAAYDPAADAWRTIAMAPGPAERLAASRNSAAVWTGTEVLVVAIVDLQDVVIDRLDPATGEWGEPVPSPAQGLATPDDGVVWTGDELLVIVHDEDGARFDPGSGSVERLPSSGSSRRFPALQLGGVVTVGDRWLDLATHEWHDADPVPEPYREFPAAASDGTAAYWWGGSGCGAAASCGQFVDPGVGLRWGPAAEEPPPPEVAAPTSTTTAPPQSTATTSTPSPSSTATTAPPSGIGAGGWNGARTSRDGRSLVVSFTGGAPYEPGVPCTVDYRVEVAETSDEVRVRVVVVQHPPTTEPGAPPAQNACPAVGYTRTVEAALVEPLGGRTVFDVEGGVVREVFDGTKLAEPTVVPEGWRLQYEHPGYSAPGTSWSRAWAPDRPQETPGEHCTGTSAGMSLDQGLPELVDTYSYDGPPDAQTHDVRGNEATSWQGPNGRSVSWVEHGQGFVVSSRLGCDRDTLATLDELLAFARALDVP